MPTIKWEKLLSNPDRVKKLSNTQIIFYHGVVGSSFYHNDQMLPGGYRQAIRRLYLSLGEELLRRLGGEGELDESGILGDNE